jgi:hypothetical protein
LRELDLEVEADADEDEVVADDDENDTRSSLNIFDGGINFLEKIKGKYFLIGFSDVFI